MAIINGRGRVGIRRPSVAAIPSIVSDGLKLYLDAGKTTSYSGTGTVWTDLSGNGNNGTLVGGPTYNSANSGSIVFDGSNDYGSIPYTIQNQFTNKISINVWVNPSWFDSGNNDGVTIIGKAMPTLTPPYGLFGLGISPNGKYNGSIGNGVNRVICTSTNTVSLNSWVNICMTYDGATIKLYKNGVQDQTTAACTYTLGQNTVPITIASNQTLGSFFDWFKGSIGVIQLYNKGLSATEVLQNYNALKSRFYPQVSDSDAQAFIYAAGIQNSTQANAVNTLVTSMKTAGVWTKMKAVYPMVGGSAASHKFNLKDPRDLDAAYRLTFTVGWVHSSTGAKGNGTSDYANTFFNPSVSSNINSSHISYYARTGSNTNSVWVGSGYAGFLQSFGGTMYGSLSTGGWMASASSNYQFAMVNRTSSNYMELRKLGVSVTSSSNLAVGYDNSIYRLNSFGNAYYSPSECAFASIGDGLTNAEATSLYTAVQTYQTALGRQV